MVICTVYRCHLKTKQYNDQTRFNHLNTGLVPYQDLHCTNFMMKSISNVVVGLNWSNEIARNQSCSLMNQLVKGMLPIGSGFTPNNRSCGVVNICSRTGDIPENDFSQIYLINSTPTTFNDEVSKMIQTYGRNF